MAENKITEIYELTLTDFPIESDLILTDYRALALTKGLSKWEFNLWTKYSTCIPLRRHI